MEGPFDYRDMIPLVNGEKIEVIDFINEGAQGYIYTVLYQGKKHALKWYKNDSIKYINKMKENIKRLVQQSNPYPLFCWPIMMTRDYRGSFGYIMQMMPSSYISLKKYIYEGNKYHLTLEEILKVSFSICIAFKKLHELGYVYQDINLGSIHINQNRGLAMICDIDNCNKENVCYVYGTPGFMAPEIIMHRNKPTIDTDRYSLAVMLFRLFYIDHPLDGKRTYSVPLDQRHSYINYGSNPIFVCDPYNRSNGYCRGYTDNVEKRWNYFPDVIKRLFIKAFTSGLKPNQRIREDEWLEAIRTCYAMLAKKEIRGQVRQGFFPLTTRIYKLKVGNYIYLLSDYKDIYNNQFYVNTVFNKKIFTIHFKANGYYLEPLVDMKINGRNVQLHQYYPLYAGMNIEYKNIIGMIKED